MTAITANEFKAMKTCLNYKTREAQLEDNFSNGGMPEFMAVLSWNSAQAAGLISSLEQKGMGWSEGKGSKHVFWLTELGVNTLFDLMDCEK